jgi:hypothetical protein
MDYVVWAGLVAGAAGFAAKDSGIIIPGLLLTVGIPLMVSAVASARRDRDQRNQEPSAVASAQAGR